MRSTAAALTTLALTTAMALPQAGPKLEELGQFQIVFLGGAMAKAKAERNPDSLKQNMNDAFLKHLIPTIKGLKIEAPLDVGKDAAAMRELTKFQLITSGVIIAQGMDVKGQKVGLPIWKTDEELLGKIQAKYKGNEVPVTSEFVGAVWSVTATAYTPALQAQCGTPMKTIQADDALSALPDYIKTGKFPKTWSSQDIAGIKPIWEAIRKPFKGEVQLNKMASVFKSLSQHSLGAAKTIANNHGKGKQMVMNIGGKKVILAFNP